MEKSLALRAVFGILWMCAVCSSRASAQTDEQTFQQFQWNFSTPGARANAMGGAFLATADDATATVTNPAGLISLTRPQFYVEYKNTDVKVDRLATVNSWLPGLHNPTTFSTDINALSFFSASVPVGKRVAVGFTIHQFLNYQESFHLAPRAVPDANNTSLIFRDAGGLSYADTPVQGDVNFQGTSYGASFAVAVTSQLNVGLTLAESHLTARDTNTRFNVNFGSTFPANPTALSESPIIRTESTINDSANGFGFAVGGLFRPNEKISVGFSYTKGPSFHLSENDQFNPGFSSNTQSPLTTQSGFPVTITIHVPDRYGVGVAARPVSKLLVGFDVVRVLYSNLARDFTVIEKTGNLATVSPSLFSIDDVTELHVGGEYNVLGGAYPLFLRAGAYTNPNHAVRFSATAANPLANSFFNAFYNLLPRSTVVKGTFGAGVVIGPHVQVDAAYVWQKEFVASLGARF
jgi:long-subunit fatty acid transport protein